MQLGVADTLAHAYSVAGKGKGELMPWACAGYVLCPKEQNGYCLVDEAGFLYRVSTGTTLLVLTTAQAVVEWVGQDLFDEAVRWQSGAIESASDFLRRLLEA